MSKPPVLSLPQLITSLKVVYKTEDVKMKKITLPGGDVIEGQELENLIKD